MKDVGDEVKNLFPNGFTQSTNPTEKQVHQWIETADAVAQLAVRRAASGTPSASDISAPIVRSYIRNSVLARVMRSVYVGNDPREVTEAARAYEQAASAELEAIHVMGEQAIGIEPESPPPNVVTSLTGGWTDRELLIDDRDLDGSRQGRF